MRHKHRKFVATNLLAVLDELRTDGLSNGRVGLFRLRAAANSKRSKSSRVDFRFYTFSTAMPFSTALVQGLKAQQIARTERQEQVE